MQRSAPHGSILVSRRFSRRIERTWTAALPWYAALKATPMTMPRNRKSTDPSIRAGLVARVRREIEKGKYDTPEKLELALERMLESMADEAEESNSD